MTWSQIDFLSRAVRIGELDAEEARLDSALAGFGKKDQVARYRRGIEAERLRLIPRGPVPPRPARPTDKATGLPVLSQQAVAQIEGLFGSGSGFGRKQVTLSPEEYQRRYGARKRSGGPA